MGNRKARRRYGPSTDDKLPVLLLQGRGIGPVLSAKEGRAQMVRIVADSAKHPPTEADIAAWLGGGEILSKADVAKRLAVDLKTITHWRKTAKIIILSMPSRKHAYPLDQFYLSRREPLRGIDLVLAEFRHPGVAWNWLVAPNRMTGNKQNFFRRPLDALRNGEVDLVVSAARGAYDFA